MASTWKNDLQKEKKGSPDRTPPPSKACLLNFPVGRVLTLVTPPARAHQQK